MKRVVLMVALMVFPAAALAADATVVRSADLRADRYVDAASLRLIDSGTQVELIGTEAGWARVKIGATTGWVRASSLSGEAAAVAPLARLEGGRSSSGNLVVAAGIRGMPKPSRHALIIAVDTLAMAGRPTLHWPGVEHDVVSARLIAQRLAVPDDNLEVVQGADADDKGIRAALDRLAQRVRPGDHALIYFSGPGMSRPVDCVPAWSSSDGIGLSAAGLVDALRPVFADAAKVIVISDASYAASTGVSRKVVPGGCASATVEHAVVPAAVAIGTPAANLIQIQAAAGPDQGLDQPRAGGVFTQVLLDCVLGDAIDADRSTSISVTELAACMDRRAPLASVSGNLGFSLITGVVPPAAAGTAPAASNSAIDDILAQRDGRIEVVLEATPSTLRIGRDDVGLAIRSSHAGYVYLILLGSDAQSFYLLFPNDLDHDHRIRAGETLRLPRASWRVQAQGPPGRDTVLAVVAESERDLSALKGRKEGPFSTALTDADGRAELQWLLGRSGMADSAACAGAGKRRNLAAVAVCSDAFGAARADIVEQ